MADTLESIYFNTAVGSTELDDGEHTILTTDSATRYVIKDMLVKDTSLLTNTYLELNGFNIGGITSNATGSLIIPPNSTLKIKSTDYPQTFSELETFANSTTNGGFKVSYKNNNNGAEVGTEKGWVTSSLGGSSDITDVQYTGYSSTYSSDFLHYTTHDTNSSQALYSWTGTSGAVAQRNTQSYRPYGINNGYAYYMANNALQETDLVNNPLGVSYSAMSVSGLHPNNYSPFTTSSYPRGQAYHGWYWFIPSSSYQASLFGIKLEGANKGQFIELSFPSSVSTAGSNNFVVSYNAATDILYVYRNSGAGTIYYDIFNNWSTTDAIQSGSRPTIYPTSNGLNTTMIAANGNMHVSNMSSTTMGYRSNGGFTYKNTAYAMKVVNPDFTVEETITDVTIDGTNFSGNVSSFWQKERLLSASEATSLGLSAPTFGIQILGIKSV